MSAIQVLSSRLNRLREQRGWSLSGLSQRCGIAKSTLSSLEAGQGNPTIETLWAIANALDVSFGSLLAEDEFASPDLDDGGVNVRFVERSVLPHGGSIETYAMAIQPGHVREAVAHPPGVKEKVVVTRGPMQVGPQKAPRLVEAGQVHAFDADVPHLYGAAHQRVQAMVFVEYPAPQASDGELTSVLDWPTGGAGWDDVRARVTRMRAEVASGMADRMLRLRGCREPAAKALRMLRAELADGAAAGGRWPLLEITEADGQGPFLAVLQQNMTRAFQPCQDSSRGDGEDERARRALELAGRAERVLVPGGGSAIGGQDAQGCWTLEALQGECALIGGDLRLPRPVEEESVFELLRPAHARQVVALAQDVRAFAPGGPAASGLTLGMEAGPGAVSLRMLQELLPGLQARAATLEPEGCSAGLVMAAGPGHGLHAAFMLQQAMRLLRPGGVLSVIDEFLPPFHDTDGRHRAWIRHHGYYILDAASWIERGGYRVPDDAEGRLYRAFRSQLAQAMLSAQQGAALDAARQCRALHAQAGQASLEKSPAHLVGAYLRFFWRELRTLVAGLEDEAGGGAGSKTHARRFLALAAATGFELLRHRRVYATHGADECDGGAHVIVLRRPLRL